MAKAPVYYVVAQVQHNPLLSLSSFIPQIQEAMRKAGYPDFQQGFNLTSNIPTRETAQSQAGTLLPFANLQRVERYQFQNADCTDGFVLMPNVLSFQTTEYDTFQSFLEKLENGLEMLVRAVAGLSFVERIGLRYLDVVVPQAGDTFRSYFAPEMLGLPALMENRTFAYSFTEATMIPDDNYQVVARTIMQNGTLGFPPDLSQQSLKVAARFAGIAGEHATLDTDGSITKRKPFDAKDTKQTLLALHEYVSECFKAMTTDHARTVWK